jgi:glutaconyl-CoA/methylmalonyl-CoA decarboxylase subunit gamma
VAAPQAARSLKAEERRRIVPVLQVKVAGRTYRVEVPDSNADPMQIVVDGEAFLVDIALVDVAVEERPVVESHSAPVIAPTSENPPGALRPAPPLAPRRCSNLIVAPMPGTVLNVPVRMGQKVAPGDVVCVLEAMKMKNPLSATQDGKVAEIAVKAGQAVAFGDLLVRLA